MSYTWRIVNRNTEQVAAHITATWASRPTIAVAGDYKVEVWFDQAGWIEVVPSLEDDTARQAS